MPQGPQGALHPTIIIASYLIGPVDKFKAEELGIGEAEPRKSSKPRAALRLAAHHQNRPLKISVKASNAQRSNVKNDCLNL